MALLEIPVGTVEVPEVIEAARLGRFFDIPEPEACEPVATVDIRTLLASMREDAFTALETRKKVDKADDDMQMAEAFGRQTKLDDAKGQKADSGAVWRRQTDEIARKIAEHFPEQQIHDTFFDGEHMAHLSDGQTLYGVNDNLEVFAYSSVITQHEMNAGISIATEEMWQDLLVHIVLTTG